MTIGEKIKRIRKFRKMTQKELAVQIGLGENGGHRMVQYESGFRVPKKDLVDKIAQVLDVNPLTLYDTNGRDATEIMEMLFWLDDATPSLIHTHQLQKFPGEKANESDDTGLYYHDNDYWPAHAPTVLWFNYGVLDQFLKEWTIRKNELAAGEITKDEYFEWKINWPQTCDDCGKHEPKKEWRKQTELLQQVP